MIKWYTYLHAHIHVLYIILYILTVDMPGSSLSRYMLHPTKSIQYAFPFSCTLLSPPARWTLISKCRHTHTSSKVSLGPKGEHPFHLPRLLPPSGLVQRPWRAGVTALERWSHQPGGSSGIPDFIWISPPPREALVLRREVGWYTRPPYPVPIPTPTSDCGSDHEILIAKFRLKLKTAGKTTRPFRYDLNHSLMIIQWKWEIDSRD